MLTLPLLNVRSLSRVSSELRMAELLRNSSSKKAMLQLGR